MSSLKVQPLGPSIGAEISGLKLSVSSKESTLKEIGAALVKHEAIVLHVPDLSPEDHLEIARYFGEAEVHTYYPNLGEGFEQITIIDSKLGDRADMWHHDESFLPSPPIVTMTHAQILPPVGGDTCWISMTAAYEALSERMQQYLEGLQAWHDMNGPMTDALRHNVVSHERYVQVIQKGQRFLHSLVKIHPITGRKALYINPTYTTHIDALPVSESNAILNFLFGHCQHVNFLFRHRWRVGDMVIWDNRSVIHNAILDYKPHQRCMHRVSVFERQPDAN